MPDEYKAPRTTVEQDYANPAQYVASEPAPAPQPQPAPQAAPQAEPFSPGKTAGKVTAWFKATFPGRENAVIFGLIGLIAAILLFVVGVWRTLTIVLFVVVGVAIGQVIDGDPKILRAIQRALNNRRP